MNANELNKMLMLQQEVDKLRMTVQDMKLEKIKSSNEYASSLKAQTKLQQGFFQSWQNELERADKLAEEVKKCEIQIEELKKQLQEQPYVSIIS